MNLCEVAESEEKGRHLVAARSIPAGQVVVRQEAYAFVLYDDQVHQRCDFCLKPCDTPLRCSRSKFARYCSREHQKAAWKAWYKQECEALVACAPKVPPPTVRLAARVLWKRQRELSSPGAEPGSSGSYAEVQRLQHHWAQLQDSRRTLFAQMAMVVRQFMQGGGCPEPELPQPREVAQLLAAFACNNHTICDEELRPLGVGLYPLGALLNHSHAPSCMQAFQRQAISFRALRPLAPGEELTISYIELAATGQERRQELLEQYLFDVLQPGLQPNLPSHTIWPQPAVLQQLKAPAAGGLAAWVAWHGAACSPPWPQLPADQQLTSLTYRPVCSSSSGGGGSRRGGWAQLPGGMHLRVIPAEGPALHSFPGVWPAEAAAAAAGDSEDELEGGLAADSGGSSCSAAAAIHVYCWGPGLALSNASCGGRAAGTPLQGPDPSAASHDRSSSTSTNCLVQADAAELAENLVQLHQLMGQAEGAVQQGQPGLAVQLLQQALARADCLGYGALTAATATAGATPPNSTLAVPAQLPATGRVFEVGLGQQHVLRLRLLAALLKACIDEGSSWQLALQSARQLQPMYELVYPHPWPNLALHYAALAKLESYAGDRAEALAAAGKAAQQLQVTHGGDSAILQEMLRLRYDLQMELQMGQEA